MFAADSATNSAFSELLSLEAAVGNGQSFSKPAANKATMIGSYTSGLEKLHCSTAAVTLKNR